MIMIPFFNINIQIDHFKTKFHILNTLPKETQHRKMMIILQMKYNPYIQYQRTNRSFEYKI